MRGLLYDFIILGFKYYSINFIDDYIILELKTGVYFRFFFKLSASAPTKNTIIFFFPCRGLFCFSWSWKKRKYYSLVLSANEIAECNWLNNKNTITHRCEKSKCRVVMCSKKNPWLNNSSSLTKTWNSHFECLSIKNCCTQNLFLLIHAFFVIRKIFMRKWAIKTKKS